MEGRRQGEGQYRVFADRAITVSVEIALSGCRRSRIVLRLGLGLREVVCVTEGGEEARKVDLVEEERVERTPVLRPLIHRRSPNQRERSYTKEIAGRDGSQRM